MKSRSFRVEVHYEFSRRGGGQAGLGSSGRLETRTKHDKKDLAVWRLADKVTKLDFRHWVGAVVVNLEAIHNWSKPDLILDLVRRQNVEVDATVPAALVKQAIEKLQDEEQQPVDSSQW